MIWALTQQQLVRIKQNFENGKDKMIETEHQNFFCHWSITVGHRPLLVKSLKGDWDRKYFHDNKNFETVIHRISFTFRLQSFSWF